VQLSKNSSQSVDYKKDKNLDVAVCWYNIYLEFSTAKPQQYFVSSFCPVCDDFNSKTKPINRYQNLIAELKGRNLFGPDEDEMIGEECLVAYFKCSCGKQSSVYYFPEFVDPDDISEYHWSVSHRDKSVSSYTISNCEKCEGKLTKITFNVDEGPEPSWCLKCCQLSEK